MIKELYVENFILIESQNVIFNKGLNVLTGETGHGKSILLKAVMLLFQGNISKKFIRKESLTSLVKGLVDISEITTIPARIVTKFELVKDVLITRTFNSKKSSITINGIDASLTELEELGKYLCQALTQFQKFELLKPEAQLLFIDSLLTSKVNKIKYEELFTEYSFLIRNKRALEKEFEQLDYVIEYKREEYEKISELDLQEEDKLIEDKIHRLENFDLEKEKLSSLLDLFNNDESGLSSSFYNFKKGISKSSISDKFDPTLNNFQDLMNKVENLLLQELDQLESSQESLEEILARYNLLKPHLKKHQNSIAKLVEHFNNLREIISRYDELNDLIESSKLGISVLEKELIKSGIALSSDRKKVADSIEKKVLTEFKELNLGDSVLKINQTRSEIQESGIDTIDFLIKTNKGGNFYSLEEVVSGGELSRIMFSLINIQKTSGQILCFDEIDAGVGGKTSIQLSKKLKEIGGNHQIICITHSPSIAVIANNHIFVSKSHKENSTITNFDSLDDELILQEIARMLGYETNKDGLDLTKNIIQELIHQIER